MSENSKDEIKSLFSGSNPFRREPEFDSPPPPPQPSSSPRKHSGNPSPNPTSPSPESKKRKKVENNDQNGIAEIESRKSRKRKRKTDDIKAQYEKRLYGEIAEEEEVVNVKVGEKRKLKDVATIENKALKNEEEEGFDNEAKLLRTVFVGNLDVKTKKKALVKEFEKFGEIESARIRSVPTVDDMTSRKGDIIKGKINDTIGRMNAYIVFSDEQSAQAALSKNMSVMGENHIRVDMACPPRKKLKGHSQLYERKKTIFVGNLPYDVKDEEIYKLFYGPDQSESMVEAIQFVRDPNTSLGKDFAHILFKSRDAANTVLRRGRLIIRDRELRLCHAAKSYATPTETPEFESKREAGRVRFSAMSKSKENSSNSEKTKASASSPSYQGVRCSTSGVTKKPGLSTRLTVAYGSYDGKDRKAKRPAVVAREAKLLMKRKLENGTPDDTHRNKRIKSH